MRTAITKKEFYANHCACPDCDNIVLMYTMINVLQYEGVDFDDRFNRAECKCGWRGPVRDLLPPLEKKIIHG
jgi:hypothetical protein